MSVRVMAEVFQLSVRSTEKLVLLAMADHARDDGTGCYPSITLLAKKTSLSYRGVDKVLKGLERAGFIMRCGVSQYQTIEYALTLRSGTPERRSDPQGVLPLNSVPQTPEPQDTTPRNRIPKTPEPGSDESKTKPKALTKDGNGRDGGGGCQDTKTDAAATARAFSAFGFAKPFGHAKFQSCIVRRSAEIQNQNLVDVMELVIQDLDSKVPPLFYEAKHAFEKHARDTGEPSQNRTPANDPFDQKKIAQFIRKNMIAIRKSAKEIQRRNPTLAAGLRSAADCLRSIHAQIKPGVDIEKIEARLVDIDSQILKCMAAGVGPELSRFREQAAKQYREPYAQELRVGALLHSHFTIPRLSLLYMGSQ